MSFFFELVAMLLLFVLTLTIFLVGVLGGLSNLFELSGKAVLIGKASDHERRVLAYTALVFLSSVAMVLLIGALVTMAHWGWPN